MIIKNAEEQKMLIASGGIMKKVLEEVQKITRVGITTKFIDARVREVMEVHGASPTFLGYKPYGAKRPYPASTCISVNDEVVHGIPSEKEYVLQDGDVVSIDVGVTYKGFITDAARTIVVGQGDAIAYKLIEAAEKALQYAMTACYAGSRVGDIGAMIEQVATQYGFTIPPEFGGHGTGKILHDKPFIPNIGDQGKGSKLVVGQVLAIEPILIEGHDPRTKLAKDGYTFVTNDGSRAVHVENTIIITEGTPIILTA